MARRAGCCACGLLLSSLLACGAAGPRAHAPAAQRAAAPALATELAALSPLAFGWVEGLAAHDTTLRRRAVLRLHARLAGSAALKPADRACLAVLLRRSLRAAAEPRLIVALLGALGWAGDRSDLPRLAPWLGHGTPTAAAALAALAVLADRGQLDQASTRVLLGPLRRPEAALRRAAAWALTRLWRAAPARGVASLGPHPARAWRSATERLHAASDPGAHRSRSPKGPWPASLATTLADCAIRDSDPQARALCLRALAPTLNERALRWLLRRVDDPSVWVQVEAVRALGEWGAAGVPRLVTAVGELWRRASHNRQRLGGVELHPILVGLDALMPHAALAGTRQLADELLELADAIRSSVSYAPAEARSMDLVHCRAAQLHDLAAAAIERTPTCGTAYDPHLDAGWRRRQVIHTIAALDRDPGWRLTLLRRYLVDTSATVRAAAVEALGVLGSAAIVPALRRGYADGSAAVVAAAARATTRNARLLREWPLAAELDEGMAAHASAPATAAICAASEALAALGPRPPPPRLLRLARGGGSTVAVICAQTALRALGAAALLATGAGTATAAQARAATTADGTALPRRPERSPAAKRAQRIVLRSDRDQVVLELLWHEAPRAAAYLVHSLRAGALTGAVPYRVLPGDLLELGRLPLDEHSDDLPEDHTAGAFDQGSVGLVAAQGVAARALFITLRRQPQLDGRFPRVARIIEGLDAVARWQAGDRVLQAEAR